MKITDISLNQDSIQGLKKLSDREATRIIGGDRNGPGDGCPPQVGTVRLLNSCTKNFNSITKRRF